MAAKSGVARTILRFSVLTGNRPRLRWLHPFATQPDGEHGLR